LTTKAFNLAEKYQCPVIILTELDMGQNFRTAGQFDFTQVKIDRGKLLSRDEVLGIEDYRRYEFTPDGISPRALPSFRNGVHIVESLEHNEHGYRDEDDRVRVRMMGKRMRKLDKVGPDLVPPRLWGERKAEAGFIGFGSTLGAILEARDNLKAKKLRSNFLQLRTLWPFPAAAVAKFLQNCEKAFIVENNFSGQLATLIKSQLSPCRELRSIVNYSTRAFMPRDIVKPVLRSFR
jgi:2-oxoglutarate ferredoxin oxidoreductase subunit alpha